MTTEINGRAILFENAICKKYGIHATCNGCERIIFQDEMSAESYTANNGYCNECMQVHDEENSQTYPLRGEDKITDFQR